MSVPGISAPVAGASPATGLDAEQYSGTIGWTPAVNGTFAACTSYTAAISLKPKPGYTLAGVAANSFKVAGAAASHGSGSGTVTAVFPPTPAMIVDQTAIAGVPAPVAGSAPAAAFDADQYSGTVDWSPAVDRTFAPGTKYKAIIELKPKAGYTLDGLPENSFTVAGAVATHCAGSGTVTAVFPSTSADTIKLLGIPGIPVPATGASPAVSFDTMQYSGTVAWKPEVNGSFAPCTAYTASIVVTPKDGYTLTGMAADSFTVAGAKTAHDAGSGLVTALFPSTSAASITLLDIPAALVPTRGSTPVVAFDAGQYTGAVRWNPRVNRTFAASTSYVATIELTPRAGYTLEGIAENSFRVAGAAATHGAGSGIITAVYPPTSAAPISILAIPGVPAPVTGAVPAASIDTDEYTGTVRWSPPASGTFSAYTAYTASIVLSPKAGYTLEGIPANSFTVRGASATHGAGSGLVAAEFPPTSGQPITQLSIPGIPPPRTGEAPATRIDASQYTGTVSWQPPVHGTFAANTVYTADIVLRPKAGFSCSGVSSNSFTVEGAFSTANGIDSPYVSAVFMATSLDIELVDVPAGSFQRDKTATNVSVVTKPFRMSRHQITQAQFQRVMGLNPSYRKNGPEAPNRPVEMVSWYHAIAFCNKLSIAEGLSPVYVVQGIDFGSLDFASIPISNDPAWFAVTAVWTNDGYRLPTAMEWMWAAMGADRDGQPGSMQDGVNRTGYAKPFAGYDGGNSIDDYAWYAANSGYTTHPVGKKGANELGLFDMSGNVWEWCWDWHRKSNVSDTHPSGTLIDYTGDVPLDENLSFSGRFVFGGNNECHSSLCAVAFLTYSRPCYPDYSIGFRVVRP